MKKDCSFFIASSSICVLKKKINCINCKKYDRLVVIDKSWLKELIKEVK